MYSEFFDQLGANRRFQRDATNTNTTNDEPTPLVSVKAGKMVLTKQPIAAAQEPTSFHCEAIRTRGEIRLLWKDNVLKWQWYDRRDREVRDEFIITTTSQLGTFERIPVTDKKHEKDRIYVWTRPDVEDEQERYKMYWMQDADEEKDDEIVASINEYLANPNKAAPDHMETEEATRRASASTTSTADTNDPDTIARLIAQLQSGISSSSETSTAEAVTGSSNNDNDNNNSGGTRSTLTLADLQGAMAGIQVQATSSNNNNNNDAPGPVLSDVVTSDAITKILQDEGARNRLMELLPVEQRSSEYLEDNLRSPAVQQTLRHLTATLLPEDDWSGFYTVLANFQLDPADGQNAIAAGNPVQAFLDCVLASVKKEKEQEADVAAAARENQGREDGKENENEEKQED